MLQQARERRRVFLAQRVVLVESLAVLLGDAIRRPTHSEEVVLDHAVWLCWRGYWRLRIVWRVGGRQAARSVEADHALGKYDLSCGCR